MGKGTIGAKIALEGEGQYRAALKQIKTEQSELRSEMKLCQSTFKDNQNSMDALEKKYSILTKQIESQSTKLEVYKQALVTSTQKEENAAQKVTDLQSALSKAEKKLEDMTGSSEGTSKAIEKQEETVERLRKKLEAAEKSYDKASQKTSEYKTALNNAEVELQEMQRELDKTEGYLKEAANSTNQCATSIDSAGKEVIDYGNILKANIASDVVMKGAEKLLGIFKDIGNETIEAAKAAANYADDIATLSVQTGVATETLQAMTYAENLMDISVDTVTSSMARNIRSMNSAKEGTESYVQAYESLGVTVRDITTGELRDSETVFWECIDALGGIENATERDALAMTIFGKSAQDLNTLVDLGSKGFKEFEKEAKDAGYVLDNDTLNALLDTSDALERVDKRSEALRRRIGSELAPELTELSEIAVEALDRVDDKIIDFAEGSIELLSDGLEWIMDNSETVITGISGISTAIVYHGTLAPMIENVATAWGKYKEANKDAELSTWLLNKAINASPMGLVATALVGLTGALVAYAIVNRDCASAVDETSQKTEQLTENSRKLNEELSKATADRETSRKSMELEAVQCKNLASELGKLQSKTNLTASEQARQVVIVEQLNQKIPELNLAINENTGKLNMSTKALQDNVEAMMALALAEAAREDFTRIAEEQFEAEKNLADLKEQLAEQTEAVAEAQAKLNEELEKYTGRDEDSNQHFNSSLAADYNRAVEAQRELEEQIEVTQTAIDGFAEEYEQTMAYIADKEALVEATSATADLGSAAQSTGEQVSGMSWAAQEAFTEMANTLTNTISGQMSLFDEFSGKAELSTSQLLTNMQSQVDGITEWSDNLTELAARGIDQGLLQKLSEMGPQGAGYVATFVQMTDEELQKANELFEQSLTLPEETTEKVMKAYTDAGSMAAEGFKVGMEESEETVTETADKLAKATLKQFQTTMDINSPSGETELMGLYLDEGLASGMNLGKADLLIAASGIASEVVKTTESELKSTIFINIGMQIDEGLRRGIAAGKSGVISEVQQMCREAVAAAKSELDINSPSKKFFYTGEMSGEGYKEGWKASMENIDAIIAESLPDTSIGGNNSQNDTLMEAGNFGREYNIQQEINIYSQQDDLIETSRKFKQSQKEAAEAW